MSPAAVTDADPKPAASGAIDTSGTDERDDKDEIRRLKRRIKTLEAQVKGQKQAIADRNRKIADLKQEAVGKDAQIATLEQTISGNNAQIAAKDATIAQLEQQVATKQDKIDDLVDEEALDDKIDRILNEPDDRKRGLLIAELNDAELKAYLAKRSGALA